jgi:uncharacterized phiE125 gp8 family phage protein
MTIRLESKRPTERRDYGHDWAPFLVDDTIASHNTVAQGVTLHSTTILPGNQTVKFDISAGTAGVNARIDHTITTVGGRVETEVFVLPVIGDEVLTLARTKEHLRVVGTSEDSRICDMIPRARLWVEDHTGLSLMRRTFTERLRPFYGKLRLSKGPLIGVPTITYLDSLGAEQPYVPVAYPPSTELVHAAADSDWPILQSHEAFEVTYTAGIAEEDVDGRLIGGMLTLIEGEYTHGYAYPEAVEKAAGRALRYLQEMVA